MRVTAIAIFISLALFSCISSEEDLPTDSLSFFISENSFLTVNDSSVIACAAGSVDSINVYYYPEPGFSNYQLWELSSTELDPSDFSNYVVSEQPVLGLFNSYLEYFYISDLNEETWVTLTAQSNEELVIAQPIRFKQVTLPTEINRNLLQIDTSSVLEPQFTWSDGRNPGSVIYFHVVSDDTNELISGTYTFDRNWQFYDLSNVVLNIRDVNPPPVLIPDANYDFTLMGVSQDNWVNLLIESPFETN